MVRIKQSAYTYVLNYLVDKIFGELLKTCLEKLQQSNVKQLKDTIH